jgi:hypothetical protein
VYVTDVSEEHITSIFKRNEDDTFLRRVSNVWYFYPEDGSDTVLRNVGYLLQDHKAPQPRR